MRDLATPKVTVLANCGQKPRHAAAIAALRRINLKFWLLVIIMRWIFTTTLLLARRVVVFVTLITITAETTPTSAFMVRPIWAIGWIWCLSPVRVAAVTIATTSIPSVGSCSSPISLIGWMWWWLVWILFWWGRCACYLGLKCKELFSLPPKIFFGAMHWNSSWVLQNLNLSVRPSQTTLFIWVSSRTSRGIPPCVRCE